MGLDFIRRAAKSFTKGWDRNRTDLANPTLFTRYPECRTREIVAQLDDRAALSPGQEIAVCLRKDGSFVLIDGMTQVGTVENPPGDLSRAIHDAGDCALGQIIRINPLSGTADVEIE